MTKRKINEKEVLNAALRQNFSLFLERSFYQVTGSNEYHHNWHLDLFSKCVMDIMDGTESRMIINVPPRSLKSICFSVAMPAFILGHNPNATFVCISHNQALADKHGLDFLTVVESTWFKQLFPGMKISKRSASKSDVQTTKGGRRMAIGLDGGILGHGGDFIIVDDPNSSDDLSSANLEAINDKFARKILTRLNDQVTGRIVVVMQRLHENDLTGSLINEK